MHAIHFLNELQKSTREVAQNFWPRRTVPVLPHDKQNERAEQKEGKARQKAGVQVTNAECTEVNRWWKQRQRVWQRGGI